ncbi:MAG: PIN domain-containing protein [Candidatus Micrarchaeota archaeon]
MEDKKVQPIIIDTNFWLLPFEMRVDLIEGLERLMEYSPICMLVPSSVHDELKMMAGEKTKMKNKRAAKAALDMIEKFVKEGKAEIVEAKGVPDEEIVFLAMKKKAWVATNDMELREKLKKRKIRTIILKDRHNIAFA